MKQNLFDKLKTGMAVTYQKMGTQEHAFYFVITKINVNNNTVDIERYSKSTVKKDEERNVYYKDISLADINSIDAKEKIIGLDASKFFPK